MSDLETPSTSPVLEDTVRRAPIAIVGVSALFPGSLDATGFWKDILAGSDLLTDVPPTHWLLDDYHDPDPSVPDKTYATRGAFLRDVPFDAMGWGVPPNIVPETDTAQLLALIVAQQVLDDVVGDRGGDVDRSRTSVILGVTSGQELLGSMVSRLQRPIWAKALREGGVPADRVDEICDRISDHYTPWNESTFPGLLGNVVAGRIANRLDLGGTNCVTDAACASTFSAISMAINELQLGDSDLVISGGVDAMNDIFMFMCFSKTPALSASGDCRPFSDQADGTMLGEGLGMVALKRLADAERDGDRIYGVIGGMGSSSDGRSKSVYAPVSEGQARALDRAYDLAGYDPATVELVEAHGTGTIAGDAAEFRGLALAFGDADRSDNQWCALGSVKSQIGHTKAAAGAAGLFKAIMALHHKVLPPTIKIDRPNPDLELEQSPFHLATRSRPWVRPSDHPRRAGVSSFGFGGSNFHVTIEEYSSPQGNGEIAPRLRGMDSELVLLSAGSSTELVSLVQDMVAATPLGADVERLSWIARSSQRQFDAGAAARLAIVADDDQDLIDKATKALDLLAGDGSTDGFSTPSGIHCQVGDARPEPVGFLFPGQGAQTIDMGGDLAMAFDVARGPWDRAADQRWDEQALLHHVVFPPTAFDADDIAGQKARLSATEWAQPAIGVASAATLRLLEQLGITPMAVGGHSFGEITALHAAGVLSEQDFIEVARRRGELMRDAAVVSGAMTAVAEPIERVTALLDEWGGDVVIANHNHPEQVVLSGPTASIEAVEERLRDAGITAKRLPVATAFHSPVVAGASESFASHLDGVTFERPLVSTYSNSTGTRHDEDPSTLRTRIGRQLAEPVRYVDMIESMYADGVRTFVEVGPGAIQSGLVGRILGDRPHLAVATERRGKSGVTSLLMALAQLAVSGHAITTDALWKGHREPDDPQARPVPKLTLPINGANYGKPYPPVPGSAEAATPAPAPMVLDGPSASPIDASSPSPAIAPASVPTPVLAPAAVVSPPVQKEAPVVSTASIPGADNGHVAPLPVPSTNGSVPAPVDMPPAMAARRQDVEPLTDVHHSAIEATQQQTADAHARYLEMMAQTHTAFLETMERGLLLGLGMTPSTPSAQPAIDTAPVQPLSAPMPPPAAATVPVQPVATPAPVDQPAPVVAEPAVAAVAAPVAPVPVAVAAAAAPAPVAPVAAASVGVDVRGLMLEVVAEKTGYPAEMLDLGMELEGDLGIDSIKRVEILSEVTLRAPGLPTPDTAVLAELVTLGQVVEYLDETAGDVAAAAAAPVPVAPVAAASVGVDVRGLMLEVVAEKTGYPAEMLDLGMELEGDLGIDSIKRVEILSEVTLRAPGLPTPDTAVLAELVTLGQVVDYLDQTTGTGTTTSDVTAPVADRASFTAAPSNGTSAPAQPEVGRHVVDVVESPAGGFAMPGLLDGRTIVVTDEGSDLGDRVVAELQSRGVPAELARSSSDAVFGRSDLGGLVYLGGLRDVDDVDQAVAVNRDCFAMTQAIGASLATSGRGVFVTVEDLGGAFGKTTFNPDRAYLAGCAALARTVAHEWPGIAAKAIDIDRRGLRSDELATALVDELLLGGPERNVGLPASGRRLTLGSTTGPAAPGELTLVHGDVVVVSGGARGVTAATVAMLAASRQLRFVLLGRTAIAEEPQSCRGLSSDADLKRALLDDATSQGLSVSPADLGRRVADIMAVREIRSTIEALKAVGSDVRYETVDVSSPESVERALDAVRSDWGPIAALIHGAGVIADKLIVEKTTEQFDRVFDTKVDGLRSLLAATSGDPLKVIGLFSSIAARTGNVGQADYAMANEVLNKVAAAEAGRRGGSCIVKSFGWGPWEGGMVSPELRARFEQLGVPLIPLHVGARLFVDELTDAVGDGVEVVFGAEPVDRPLLDDDQPPATVVDMAVDAVRHPMVIDHAIGDTPVVPVVVAADWMARVVGAMTPGRRVVALSDIEVVRGMSLDGFGSTTHRFTVSATPVAAASGAETWSTSIVGDGGSVHYRALVEVQAADPDRAILDRPERALQPWTAPAIYDGRVLFHGPAFHVIDAVSGVSSQGIDVSVRNLTEMGWPGTEEWMFDPAALDGALQAALLWCDHALGGSSLPTRIERLVLHRSGPAATGSTCRVIGRAAEGARATSDVVIEDEFGDLYAEIVGLDTHVFSPAS